VANSHSGATRVGRILDLGRERHLTAALEFAPRGEPERAELLVMNGGSRAEELWIASVIAGSVRRERRAMYCVDAGTSINVLFPLMNEEAPENVFVRIEVGSDRIELVPAVTNISRTPAVRGGMALALAACFLLVAASGLDRSIFRASIEPEPIAAAPVSIVARATRIEHLPSVPPAPVPHVIAYTPPLVAKASVRSYAVRRIARAPLAATIARLQKSQPKMSALSVPATAKNGDLVHVAYSAVAQRVRIVASIGPTIVGKAFSTKRAGVIAFRPPASNRDGRVMTVRAYALDGTRSASLQAMVVLVGPG